MLTTQAFNSQYSLHETCVQAASGCIREGIAPFIRTLNEDAALTFSRQGPYLLTLPSESQCRILMFLSWLCRKGLVGDGVGDLAALAGRLLESARAKDVSIPPLCQAIISVLSTYFTVRKASGRAERALASLAPSCDGNNTAPSGDRSKLRALLWL